MKYLHDRQIIFYFLLFISLVLIRLPYIGIYFRIINTLIHESAHAFAGLLLTGKLSRIELFADTSGTATITSKSKFYNLLISIAGYPVSTITAYLFFRLIKYEHFDFILYVLAFLVVVNIILFVRNKYGIFWLITFAVIMFFLFYYGNSFVKYCFTVFFSCIIMMDSIVSALILLKLSFKDGKKAGDATNLRNITHIPAFFWSLFFVCLSVFFFYLTAILYFPFICNWKI
jgi:hypothetical protein